MTWVVFVAYLALLLLVGEVVGRTRVASLEDYLLSGRRHGTWVTAAALVATVIGAGSTIGAAGVAYYVGVSAGWYLLSAVPALLLLGFTLAPAYRRLSLFSVPEYLGRRYGARAGVLAAGLGLVGLVLFLSAQLYAMGALLERVTGVGQDAGLVVSAAAVIVYTWRGGNWAVHASDSIQVVWILAGAGLAVAAALSAVGGLGALAEPPAAAGFERLGQSWFHPVRRSAVGGWDPFALGDTVLAWIVMSTTWHFAMQSTAQRILSSRDEESVRRACVIAAVALIPLAVLFAALGMSARELLPELRPPRGAAMLEQVEALPALLVAVLGPLSAGLVLAALVAVVMSTCDSALLGASTLLLKDLLPRLDDGGTGAAAGPEAGSEPAPGSETGTEGTVPAGAEEAGGPGELARSRRHVLGLGGLALAAALLTPGLVQTLELVAAVYCVALFAPLLVGHYWDGATEAGALASMAGSGLAGVGWRASGLEAELGIHMLNVALPVAAAALLVVSWARWEVPGPGSPPRT